MASRERKRAERRKRIERSERKAELHGGGEAEASGEDAVDLAALAADVGSPPAPAEPEESASERRNREAREQLEPLAEGERPLVVTLGAITSLAIAASIVIAWIAGSDVTALQTFPPAVLFGVMAAGMWRARYWAVLGFEAVMAFLIIIAFLNIVAATSLVRSIGPFVILLAAGAFFWYTIKALARIQMPGRDPRL